MCCSPTLKHGGWWGACSVAQRAPSHHDRRWTRQAVQDFFHQPLDHTVIYQRHACVRDMPSHNMQLAHACTQWIALHAMPPSVVSGRAHETACSERPSRRGPGVAEQMDGMGRGEARLGVGGLVGGWVGWRWRVPPGQLPPEAQTPYSPRTVPVQSPYSPRYSPRHSPR